MAFLWSQRMEEKMAPDTSKTGQHSQQKLHQNGMDTPTAATYLGISPGWLRARRCDGSGPAYHRLGRRAVYLKKDLDEYLAINRIATVN